MDNEALGAARRRAAARATALQHEVVPPLPLHKVRPSSPPTRTRTRLGTAPSEADERAAEFRAELGKAEAAAGGQAVRSTTGQLKPWVLRRTTEARRQLGAMIALWAMFARGRRANREAREVEGSLEGRMRAAAKRATAEVRPSTGRTFGATAAAVKEQLCHAFGHMDGGVGLPWPSRPPRDANESIEVVDDDDELGGGGVCRMALLVPHGDLGGMSGLTAAYAYRQLWEAADTGGFPEVVVVVGTTEPWGHVPADWEEAAFTTADTEPPAVGAHSETNAAVQAFSEKISPSGKIAGSIHSQIGKGLFSTNKALQVDLEPETEPEVAAAQRKNQIDAHIDASLEIEVALCSDRWDTPLGIVEPHNSMIEKLAECGYRVHSGMHRHQESIEAQLPFLQALKPDIRIVPILVGKLNRQMAARLATNISSVIAGSGHAVGLIGCSNLGHSGPMYGRTSSQRTARGQPYSHAQSDSDLADSLCAGASSSSVQAFNKRAQRANVCGRWTAIVLMLAARSLNLRQGRVLARRTTVDTLQNMVGHAAIVFGPKADEELAPPQEREAPPVIKRASDGTILAGSSSIFTPAERIPKVVPKPEALSVNDAGRTCHSIGDAMCYWHEQQTQNCIGVIITLPCFPSEDTNEKDAELDAYGSGRNREPKMTPRTTSELSVLGASDLSFGGDGSNIQTTTVAGAEENVSSQTHMVSRTELRNRVFALGSTDGDCPSSSTGAFETHGCQTSELVDGDSSSSQIQSISPTSSKSLGQSHGASPARSNARGLMSDAALKAHVTSSSSLNSTSSTKTSSSGVYNAARLTGQRKRMADGPGGVYKHMLPEVSRQGWAVLQLIWPTWAQSLDQEQLVRFAVLAARDAARWVLNIREQTPLVLVGWGSSAAAAIEAGARLAWDFGRDTVDAVATLSKPGLGLEFAGTQTLEVCERALKQTHQCPVVKLTGAEEYCPGDTHALGGVLQRQAHVTSIISMLSDCSKDRDNGNEDAMVERATRVAQHMPQSPAWKRLQARFGMQAQESVHIGEYNGTGDAGSNVRLNANPQAARKDWQPTTTRARSLLK